MEKYCYVVKEITTVPSGDQTNIICVVANTFDKAWKWIREYVEWEFNEREQDEYYEFQMIEQGRGYAWYKVTNKRGETYDHYICIDVITKI